MRALSLAGPLAMALAFAFAAPAGAKPVQLMVAPFGDEGAARALSDALELELELVETVVLSSPKALFDELGTKEVAGVDDNELADALVIVEQEALVFGLVANDGGQVVVALFRTNDAAVIHAERIALESADVEREARRLSASLARAAFELQERARVPDDELVALGLKEPAPVVERRAQQRRPRVDDDGPPSTTTAKTTAKTTGAAPVEASALSAGLDRLGRVSLAWSPMLLYYRACQPADVDAAAAPFVCEPAPGVPSTEALVTPLAAPAGVVLGLEIFPVSFAGVEARTSVGWARVAARRGDETVDDIAPNPFAVAAGDVAAAVAVRIPFGSAELGGTAGTRAGYHLSWAVAEEHTLSVGERSYKSPLVPTWASHHGLLGLGLGFGYADLVRATLDVDALVGPHMESPTRVGDNSLALGGRARLGVDVHLGLGFLLITTFEGSAISVGSEGESDPAPRYTRALTPFRSGQVVIVDGRFGIGVGYRY